MADIEATAGWQKTLYEYDGVQPHAVTSLSGSTTATYEFDANGNMTCRTENGITYKQNYNAENRISAIHLMNGNCETGTSSESWSYVYDGDGTRVSTAHFTGLDPEPDSLRVYFMGEGFCHYIYPYYDAAGSNNPLDTLRSQYVLDPILSIP